MADKMLIDATHPEETRVVVLRGNRVEEFDFESANRKQLRGNIYLAKVTRVEPSLQAAFIDYGGNRHGFLAFSEIHPDYYQIPVADRQALIAEEERAQRAAEADYDNRSNRRGGGRHRHRRSDRNRDREILRSEPLTEPPPEGTVPQEFATDTGEMTPAEALAGVPPEEGLTTMAAVDQPSAEQPGGEPPAPAELTSEAAPVEAAAEQAAPAPAESASADTPLPEPAAEQGTNEPFPAPSEYVAEPGDQTARNGGSGIEASDSEGAAETVESAGESNGENGEDEAVETAEAESVESVGGADALEEAQERAPRIRPRQYKIQEVIKRRQVMLVQVVKEERGSKGAALTTYLSLAGRYSVLMPNTARGGGISRKITSSEDRSRLKEIAQELEVPEGMGVILRTAGAARTKAEVKRDFEYLLRLWEQVRDLTLKSMAPTLVYEEGSLVKRSIRDLYSKDIDEIIVSGEKGHEEARDFMRMLMPSHVRNVKAYKDPQPLFTRYGIESQLDAMFSPVVQLRSGGYIVINQAEALVAIDVNSGRATREHHIEDTALKTNCEAAEEVARQLRLRDLAGLIVIDFIDMDESRNNRTVERRLKDALKHDRARIQVGRISHFGLLEMSRQRIRTSVLESSTEKCPVCGGSGHVRSVSSVSLQLLRAIEEMLIKGATHNLIVRTRSEVALYVLNHKRAHLRELEERFRITITISADPTVTGQQSYVIDRGEQVHSQEEARAIAAAAAPPTVAVHEEEEAVGEPAEAEAEFDGEADEAGERQEIAITEGGVEQPRREGEREGGRRRRRRGRGRGRGRGGDEQREAPQQFAHDTAAEHAVAHEDHDGGTPGEEDFEAMPHLEGAPSAETGEGQDDGARRRRRRGRRGGRRNRHRNGEGRYQGGEQQPQEMHVGADFPPVSEEDADAMAPPFDRPAPTSDAAPPAEARSAYEQPVPPPPAPAAAPGAPPVDEMPPTEAPRRRSTIREPAPMAGESAPAPSSSTLPPPPAPVVVSTGEPAGQPKRGWWAKRLLGDKS